MCILGYSQRRDNRAASVPGGGEGNSVKLRSFFAAVLAMLVLAAGARAAGPPEIYTVSPNEGAAGDTILLKGRRFSGTIQVIFAVGSTSKKAAFKVMSDKELSVTVPDYYLPDRTATLVVITGAGATVGMPASTVRIDGSSRRTPTNAAFFHVQREGVAQTANGISLIEDGGAVKSSNRAPLHFVKRGGMLETFGNASGLIVQERGAIFGRLFEQQTQNSYEWHLKHVVVPEISGSLGIDPFLFKTPPQAAGETKLAPSIKAIEPAGATYGEEVLLKGRGFLGTTQVYLDRGMGHDEFLPVGFKVLSDTRLRMIMPDKPQPHGHELVLMVVTPKGMTVTVPPSRRTMRSVERKQALFAPGRQGSSMGCFFLPKENGIWFKPGGGALQVVERGVRVGDAMLVFAKNGAKITPYHPRVLFYEPQADVPQATVGGRQTKAARSFSVDKIVISEMDLLRIKLPWE